MATPMTMIPAHMATTFRPHKSRYAGPRQLLEPVAANIRTLVGMTRARRAM